MKWCDLPLKEKIGEVFAAAFVVGLAPALLFLAPLINEAMKNFR